MSIALIDLSLRTSGESASTVSLRLVAGRGLAASAVGSWGMAPPIAGGSSRSPGLRPPDHGGCSGGLRPRWLGLPPLRSR